MASASPGTPAGPPLAGGPDRLPSPRPTPAGPAPAGAPGTAPGPGAGAGPRPAASQGPAGRRAGGAPRGPQPASPGPARRDPRRPGARVRRADGAVATVRARGARTCRTGPAGLAAPVDELGVPAPMRLTRRGRRVVAGVSVAIGLSVAAVTAVVVTAAGQPFDLAGSSTVVVQPGDTLWGIAREVAPQDDPRAVVDAIEDLNGLHDGELMAGQVLRLP